MARPEIMAWAQVLMVKSVHMIEGDATFGMEHSSVSTAGDNGSAGLNGSGVTKVLLLLWWNIVT